MKKYVVQWQNNELEFLNIRDAVGFAERKGLETKSSAYVWVETDGVREEEPFFTCSWGI